MNANERELIYGEEEYKVAGAAMAVSNALGCGFLEAVYQEAMEVELSYNRIPFEAQKRIKIEYRGRVLQKEYVADFVCYGGMILEIKAIKKITEVEEAQLLNYLNAARLPIGLIVNFGAQKLEWKRYVNTKNEKKDWGCK
jgi:GxxExxY protein